MDFRGLPIPSPPSSLLTFTTAQIHEYYPHLPAWAVNAFHVLKLPQEHWTREARALLNMAPIPPFGNSPSGFVDGFQKGDWFQLFGGDAEEARRKREEVDLWRLNLHLHEAKKGQDEGWEQSGGMRKKLVDEDR
ncbi:hypothetical protein G6514_009268 [Epicoccum nigrum]|nr:hypothetical protein G6514_009268 [Epicoccum nigrum]